MHPPLFIKKNMLLDDIFRLFEKERPLIAIVKDRVKVLGIITMEDLLEQIVGPIYDESDV
jgi:CBS domain containing-hemolysin-like protein